MGLPMLRLSDSELTAVMAAARPIDPDLRDPFLRAVASALQGQTVIGPGVVALTCAELLPRLLLGKARPSSPLAQARRCSRSTDKTIGGNGTVRSPAADFGRPILPWR